jgi:hypothetical protein
MMIKKRKFIASLVIPATALLTACNGGGGGGGSGSVSEPPVTPAEPQTASVVGAAVKGTVKSGKVELFSIQNGVLSAEPIASTVTDGSGVFAFEGLDYSGPGLIKVSAFASGETGYPTYLVCDFQDGCGVDGGGNPIAFGDDAQAPADFELQAVVPSIVLGETVTTHVTLLTHLAGVLSADNLTAEGIASANARVAALFGLVGNLTELEPIDITDAAALAAATPEQQAAAIIASAMAAIAADYSLDMTVADAIAQISDEFLANGGSLVGNEFINTDMPTLEEIFIAAQALLEGALSEVDLAQVEASINNQLTAAQNAVPGAVIDNPQGTPLPVESIAAAKAVVTEIVSLGDAVTFFSEPGNRAGANALGHEGLNELLTQESEAILNALGVSMVAIKNAITAQQASFDDASGLTVTYDDIGAVYSIAGTLSGVTISIDAQDATSISEAADGITVVSILEASTLSDGQIVLTIDAGMGSARLGEPSGDVIDLNGSIAQTGAASFAGQLVLSASSVASDACAPLREDSTFSYNLSYSYISTGLLGGAISAGTGEINSFGNVGDYPDLPGGLYVYDENPELPNAKTGLGGTVSQVFSTGTLDITGDTASLALNELTYQNRIVVDDFWTNNATLSLAGTTFDAGAGAVGIGGVWGGGGNLYCTDPAGFACAGLPGVVNGVASIGSIDETGQLQLIFDSLADGGEGVISQVLDIETANGTLVNSTNYVVTINGEPTETLGAVIPDGDGFVCAAQYLAPFGHLMLSLDGDISSNGASVDVMATVVAENPAARDFSYFEEVGLDPEDSEQSFAFDVKVATTLAGDPSGEVAISGGRVALKEANVSALYGFNGTTLLAEEDIAPLLITRGNVSILVQPLAGGGIEGIILVDGKLAATISQSVEGIVVAYTDGTSELI